MQVKNLQELVAKLRDNGGMQVETTTLGKALGPHAERATELLGPDILERQVLMTAKEGLTQIVDLNSGFVISFRDVQEILPKLVNTFTEEVVQRPNVVASVEDNSGLYKDAITKVVQASGSTKQHLHELRETIYKSGSAEDRIAIVEKTVKVLECHKNICTNTSETQRIMKAQEKLGRIVTHLQSRRLAPGQVPSVYEIAIWEWVN